MRPSGAPLVAVPEETPMSAALPLVGNLMVAPTIPANGRHQKPLTSFHTFDSLADSNFRWFFFSMFGWFASMNMQMLVRPVIAYDMTGSYAALGFISLANAIPGLFLSLPGGVVADRMTKKYVVQFGQVSNLVTSAIIAALLLMGTLQLWHLVVSAVYQGAVNAIMMPARQSMIPEIVSKERLMNAVALNSSGMNLMRLMGPGLGGLLMAGMGAGWVYVLMAVMYGLGGLLLLPVRKRSDLVPEASHSSEGVTQSITSGIDDIRQAFQYIGRDRTVLTILMVNFVIVLFSMPYQTMLPGFAKDVLGAEESQVGLLMSITGVGSLVGSLVIASMPERNRGRVLLGSSVLLGVAMLAFAASSLFWVSAIVVLAIGVGQAGRMSLSNVLIQTYTQSNYQGRVMSVYMLEFSLVAFGTFLISLLSDVIGPQMALGMTAGALVAFTLASLVSLPRMRNLP